MQVQRRRDRSQNACERDLSESLAEQQSKKATKLFATDADTYGRCVLWHLPSDV